MNDSFILESIIIFAEAILPIVDKWDVHHCLELWHEVESEQF